jgi:hypothetical protein
LANFFCRLRSFPRPWEVKALDIQTSMKPLLRSASLALVAGLLAAACVPEGDTTPSGTGGSTGPGAAGTTGSAGNNGTAGMSGGAGNNGNPGSAGNPGTSGTTGSAGSVGPGGTTGTAGSGAAGTTGAGGTAGSGAAGTTGSGGSTAGRGGTAGTAGRGGTTGTGGSTAGRGGTAGSAGRGGSTGTAGTGGGGVIISPTPLDCGPNGWAVENHGPPANRVNYVVLGDGYTSAQLGAGGLFEQHMNAALTKRFSAVIGQVYGRYRNFVNICGIKLVSNGAICGSSALGCCGSDSSRLATCTSSLVNAAFSALPASLSIDWRAVVLNGSSWWNTGSATMLWSGGGNDAAGAALHEGGHGFHQLADEYGTCTGASCGSNTNGSGSTGQVYAEVNSCGNPATTDGKWDMWMGYNQVGATGIQSTWSGSRYVGVNEQYRPSQNSMMNSLFGNNVNTSFNSPSREQMVMSIWRVVKPIDSTEPAAGAVTSPGVLKVNVIDPAVISVDWTVDGGTPMVNGGTTFDTSTLGAGSHTVSARAYDNADMDLVRYRTSACPSSVTGNYCHRTAWRNSIQTVMWTFSK